MQGTRYEYRKKKRANTILNVAIGLVVSLIIVFGALIFLGSSDTEEVALEAEETEEVEESTTVEDPATTESEETTEQKEESEEALNEEEATEEEEDDLEPAMDGNFEPVGTSQSGEFNHDFTRGSTNWNEMERAFRYATGLGEDMILWRVGNNGPTSAIGTVSGPDPSEQGTPYKVQIDWVDGQGWMPVNVERLSSNPYR